MVDAVSTLKPFTTVNYTTKDGEHISATKNNGVVTLVGDKNGTRQMPVDDFMKEFVENLPVLEKTPEKDTVEISKPAESAQAAQTPAPQAPVQEASKEPEVGKKLDVAV